MRQNSFGLDFTVKQRSCSNQIGMFFDDQTIFTNKSHTTRSKKSKAHTKIVKTVSSIVLFKMNSIMYLSVLLLHVIHADRKRGGIHPQPTPSQSYLEVNTRKRGRILSIDIILKLSKSKTTAGTTGIDEELQVVLHRSFTVAKSVHNNSTMKFLS